MAATALIEGRGLVIRDLSPEMAKLVERMPDIIGKPLEELYPEPGYQPLLALIDIVRVTGYALTLPFQTPYGLRGQVLCHRVGPELVEVSFRPCESAPELPEPLVGTPPLPLPV